MTAITGAGRRGANQADQAVQVTNPGVLTIWHQRWEGLAPVEVIVDRNRGHELPAWGWAEHAWIGLLTQAVLRAGGV